MGTWQESPDAIEVDVIAGTLHFTGDLALDHFSVAVRLFQRVDSLLVFGLLLRGVDGSLLLVNVGNENLDLFAFFDLSVGTEGRKLGYRKDPFRFVADVDENLALIDLNDSSGDYVSTTVHFDVAFGESVFHLDSLFHALLTPAIALPQR